MGTKQSSYSETNVLVCFFLMFSPFCSRAYSTVYRFQNIYWCFNSSTFKHTKMFQDFPQYNPSDE